VGDCIYIRGATDGHPLEEREIRSEWWAEGEGAEAGRILAKGHFANTTLGVWFYWSDLQDKVQLRRELLALVDHVTAPEYRAERIERAKRRPAGFRAIGELRRKKTDKKGETK